MSAQTNLLLPAGTRLVHIGPHKTGTTTVQNAFFLARERLAEHGVSYPGYEAQPARAALAVTGQRHLIGEGTPRIRHWEDLVADAVAAGDRRAVVSSEFFSEADDEAIRRVVGDMGGSRVHIVVTLRPLAKIVPSQWQQWVQNGLRTPYEKWLSTVLTKPHDHDRSTRKFWARHDHAQLVRRWSEVVGPDNLTVIVIDESDGQALLRTFESMVGLPDGFLVLERSQTNRSLTLVETEIVQRLNHEFRNQKWPDWTYARYMRRGAVMHMKAARPPAAGEPRIVTPQWALKRAAEIGAEAVDTISGLGVRVIGDLSTLAARPADSASTSTEDSRQFAVEAAVHAVAGAVLASGDTDPSAQIIDDKRVRHVPSRVLLKVVARRFARRCYRALGAPRWLKKLRP